MIDPNWVLVAISIGLPVLGFIVWLVRLEGKLALTGKRIDAVEERVKFVEKQQANFDSKIAIELREMNTRLAHIEGFLKQVQTE